MQFQITTTPNEEASRLIAEKPIFKQAVYQKLLPEIKARAFTMAAIDDADILHTVRSLLAEVPRGADWGQTRANIATELLKEWGQGLEGEAAAKATRRAHIRAEFNLRFHTFQAYQAGRWETMQSQKQVFPFWQYLAFGDNRVRPTHQALHGLILPADDPFWDDHYPPWEWGCRCMVRAVSRTEYLQQLDRDRARDPDNRNILPDPLRDRMRQSGQLTRAGQTIDVRSPAAKATAAGRDPASAFGWNPANLRLNAADLQKKYEGDPDTWNTFQGWAANQPLDEGRTVLDWINNA